jgi:ABC-type transport system substrate-binding protein
VQRHGEFHGVLQPRRHPGADAASVDPEPAKRAVLFEKIDQQIANDVPWVPLYQKPTYFVYKSSIHGMVDDPNSQGPTWNVESWSRS